MNEDAKQIGAEVIDVRLKRVDFAPEVSERVFDRMQSERKRVANERRATGAAESEKIRADADRQRDVIIARRTATRSARRARATPDRRSCSPRRSDRTRSSRASIAASRPTAAASAAAATCWCSTPTPTSSATSAARVRRRARPAPSEAGVPSLVVALGLMLILEGLLPLLSPSGWREAMRRVAMRATARSASWGWRRSARGCCWSRWPGRRHEGTRRAYRPDSRDARRAAGTAAPSDAGPGLPAAVPPRLLTAPRSTRPPTMPRWLLPESISDILPSEAGGSRELRRRLLDLYRTYGYEL
jgi:hypothetical protein